MKIIRFDTFDDDRGVFAETWSESFKEHLQTEPNWVQDSFSISKKSGTVRGLHFQTPPAQQPLLPSENEAVIYLPCVKSPKSKAFPNVSIS